MRISGLETTVEIRHGLLSQPHLGVGSTLTGLETEEMLTLELLTHCSLYHIDGDTSQLPPSIP